MVKNPPASAGNVRDTGSIPVLGRAWEEGMDREYPLQYSPLENPMDRWGESHGQRSLEGYDPQGHKESDMTEAV